MTGRGRPTAAVVIAGVGVFTAVCLLVAGVWSSGTIAVPAINSATVAQIPARQDLAPVPGSDAQPGAPGALPGESDQVVPPEANKEPTAQQKAAASQCAYARWGRRPDDRAQARAVMKGRTELSGYGTLTIAADPDWRPQPTLDSAGNGHIYSLWWALPLLRVGVAEKNQPMIDRFYQIITDFILDDPLSKPEVAALVGQIESGSRMLSFTCALAGPAPNPELIAGALANAAASATHSFRVVNNTSFHQAAGIFSAGCALRARSLKSEGLRLMSQVTKAMVNTDGSVNEGSTVYARNTYLWTKQEISRIRACGRKPPAALARANRIPTFLTYALRPDGNFEALGDGELSAARWRDAPAGSGLQYASTAGRHGHEPARLFAEFDAGFIFGRSTWRGGSAFRNASYYSVRTGPGPSAQYHAHSDAGSVTFSSRGSPLLLDAGAYGYTADAAAFFVRSRLAHNLISLPGLTSASPQPRITHASNSRAGDLVSLIDNSYPSNPIRRSIWYDRRGDFIVVMDAVGGQRRKSFQNWNLGVDRGVQIDGSSAVTTGPGANLSVVSIGNTPGYSVASGETSPWRGWNSASYGDLAPAPSLHVEQDAASARYVTVLIPRSARSSPNSVSATGSLTNRGAEITVRRNRVHYDVLLRPSEVAVGAAARPRPPQR